MTAARQPRPRPLKAVAPKADPAAVVVDVNDLTAGEIEDIEDLTGLPIAQMTDLTKPQGKMNRALGYVFRRRTDPDITFEGARDLKVFFKANPDPPVAGNGS